jgi:hypothetical protein
MYLFRSLVLMAIAGEVFAGGMVAESSFGRVSLSLGPVRIRSNSR